MKRALLFLFAAVSLGAQTTTTTVAQTITGPDGNNVNGTVLVHLTAACKSGSNYVGQETVAVNFLNGALSVGLVPNDTCLPSGSYAATFLVCLPSSAATLGKPCPQGAAQQWSQNWVVPTSSSSVTVASVTVPGATTVQYGLIGDVQGALGSNKVVGIQGKPVSSTAPTDGQLMQYVASAGAWEPVTVNLSGSATAIQGKLVPTTAPTDGQLLRYSASAGQWLYVSQVTQETPSGTLDGTNTAFTLSYTPVAGLMVTNNGLIQQAGVDFNISGNTLTFVTAATPQPDDMLAAWYQH